ncbi:hypothetical protein [Calycomorphotria hydatis]|uniref:DUF3150 domain-containing protein n=1 Tax=Calycomorphotria hydatis TaxID=2528027 RepID=A0A517T8P0_9PLAN|nr:hypothetical protein [Calycomorphotria hydatis]QDT64752.1 hypothetical protein V22_19930 [Calycomorphotria hydatis]
MPETLTAAPPTTDHDSASNPTDFANRLRRETTAIRLHITWPGTRKSLTTAQRDLAAANFDAKPNSLSAGKKLLDTSHPAFKAVTSVKTRVVGYWKGVSLPYVEPGVRLIRRMEIDHCNEQLTQFQKELEERVCELADCYEELVESARSRLGDLFDPSDYDRNVRELFRLSWDYPSVEPPVYLRRLSPELYEAESRRVAARFSEAVALAEHAFAEELAQLIGHLAERLSGATDGKPKVFRDSAVDNFAEFFEKFRSLNLGSNEELDQLVNDAEQLLSGVRPETLRTNTSFRQEMAASMSEIGHGIDEILVNQPRRRIERRAR